MWKYVPEHFFAVFFFMVVFPMELGFDRTFLFGESLFKKC